MKQYYKERAPVYDRVYSYPERQDDLRQLESYIPTQFVQKDVIEIAAGTGYWTQFISKTAASILSTDITEEALIQIKHHEGIKHVTTKVADAYSLCEKTLFNAAFAGLWYSHIPVKDITKFYTSLHSCLRSGSTVIFIDNTLAQCDRLPLSYIDKDGNTYQDRALDSGCVHRVLKNFPSKNQLFKSAENFGEDFIYKEFEHFWLFQYTAL